MTDQQIETFLAVAKHLNYRVAAEMMYITQPAVSKQISLLERDLGFRLFSRSKRDLALTPSGKLFYEFAIRMRDEFEHCCMQARQMQNHKSLSICMQINIRNQIVTNAVSSFIKEYPSANVRFEYCDSYELTNSIAQRYYDLFIASRDAFEPFAGLEQFELGRVGFSFLVKKGYMDVYSLPESLAVYRDCTFIDPICIPNGSIAANKRSALPMESRMGRVNCFGLYPNQIVSVSNWQSVIQSIKLGMGITLVTDAVEVEQSEDLFRIPIGYSVPILASWDAGNHSETLNAFLQLLKEEHRKHAAHVLD